MTTKMKIEVPNDNKDNKSNNESNVDCNNVSEVGLANEIISKPRPLM